MVEPAMKAWCLVTTLLLAPAAFTQVCPVPFSPLADSLVDAEGSTIHYDDVVDGWFTGVSALPVRTCPNGQNQCILVPWYHNSSQCDIEAPSKCGWTNASTTQGCQVSDEFSQVGMALAMGTGPEAATRFAYWYNTLQAILVEVDGTADKLPAWIQAIDWTNPAATIAVSSTDDASDATARIIVALYLASHSTAMTSQQQRAYLDAANQLASAFAAHDFVKRAVSVGKYTVTNWLASGWVTAKNRSGIVCAQDCDAFGYAGYYGDAVIALLAAYGHTLDSSYLSIANDTIQNYLAAAAWTPGTFRVPPTSFWWQGSPPTAVCKTNCAGSDNMSEAHWDESDAPRAVSLCKAAYYQTLLGLARSSDLQAYCSDWMATHSLSYNSDPATYKKKFTVSGVPFDADGSLDSYFNNGLGTYLNFLCGGTETNEVATRLNSIFHNKYRKSVHEFYGDSCFGVYNQAFTVIDFGSAIGRDRAAFTRATAPTTLTATAGPSSVSLSWTPIGGAVSYEISRRSTGTWTTIAASATTYDDVPPAGAAYIYRVRGVYADGSHSLFSNDDLATPFAFTDDPLPSGVTPIRAAHVDELRRAVDEVQQTAGIIPGQYTDSTMTPGVTFVRSAHLNEVRGRLDAARGLLGLPPVTYSGTVAIGAPIRAMDIRDLREGTR